MMLVLLLAAAIGTSIAAPPGHASSSQSATASATSAARLATTAGSAGSAGVSSVSSSPEPEQRHEGDSADTLPPEWVCPEIGAEWDDHDGKGKGPPTERVGVGADTSSAESPVTCSCDLPHTLRCTGGASTLQVVGATLRSLPPRYVSLLDATVAGVSVLTGPVLSGVALHGLVVSGDLRAVQADAFVELVQDDGEPRLQALGLPGNLLDAVPAAALRALPGLDRLDLSHNRLRSLQADAFQGMSNLTFLDLSDNQLTDISPAAFASLTALRVLRLTGNRLRVAPLSLLEGPGLRRLEELDLASNQLAGPLGPGALPRLPSLRALNLAHNQLSSVRRGALSGLPALASLALPHNMVDVLEDHAFRQLGSLTALDLANNRIVAVSGASLAHLGRLRVLSLQHNFLRVLTADLVRPLAALQELHLDDNDISLVAEDALEALEAAGRLSRLTLAENPLNCDCSLAPFAWWLRNATQLPATDKASAVCAAPPHLENGLLEDVAVAELLCQENADPDQVASQRTGPGGRPQPLSDTRVTLRALQWNGSRVSLLWGVDLDVSAAPYVCDALFVYEEEEAGDGGGGPAQTHEVLLESTPLGCDSSQLADPRSLLLSLPLPAGPPHPQLTAGRRYRFCLVLLEGGGGGAQDDLTLVVGCSDVLPLVKTAAPPPAPRQPSPPTQPSPSALPPRISGLTANLTSTGALAVWVQLSPSSASSPSAQPCRLALTVFAAGALAAQERLNCSMPAAVIGGLGPAPLQVCVTAGEGGRTRCTSVSGRPSGAGERLPAGSATAGLVAALCGLVAGAGGALLLALWLAARWRRAARGPPGELGLGTGQLYRPPPSSDEDQHSSFE